MKLNTLSQPTRNTFIPQGINQDNLDQNSTQMPKKPLSTGPKIGNSPIYNAAGDSSGGQNSIGGGSGGVGTKGRLPMKSNSRFTGGGEPEIVS